MLVNLWYVAEWSKTVKDEPVQVKMLGQKFVLYRDSAGQVHCLSDVCLHRGGSLSGGWNKGDSVACPYHGWRFNGDGCVTYIPSEGPDFTPPDRARVDAYPTQEAYGMIWVFLGDAPEEERFPLPDFPEYADPAWKAITDEWNWKAEAARVVENGIDIAHASFVHPMFGMEATALENQIVSIEKNDYHGKSENIQYPPQFKDGWLRKRMRKERQPTVTKPEWHLSGMTVRIQIDINPTMSILMFDANTPVDEHNTRTFATQLRTFFKQDFFDGGSRKRLRKVFREDTAVIERAAPNYLPERLLNEMSVKDDKFMSTFRTARRRLIEQKGWQIDSRAVAEHAGRKVLTIPSPHRRSHPQLDWVIDTVPLVPAVAQPAPGKPVADEDEAAA
jgi:phenylpropionate dioxygenase-like ring-hydroxylating dioxygenase large terminal subunit